MLLEVRNLHAVNTVDRVPDQESSPSEIVEGLVDVMLVVGEDSGLDALGAVLKAPADVSQAPEPDKEQPGQRVEFGKLVVRPEARLDGADSHSSKSCCCAADGAIAGSIGCASSRFTRSTAVLKCRSSISMPMARRPVRMAAIRVVPEPM